MWTSVCPVMCSTSLVEYTTLRVDTVERVIALSDPKMLESPFCYLAGHKLVQFNPQERKNLERYVKGGGFLFVDDCNHDIDGLFAKSFEAEMIKIFGIKALKKIPNNHPLVFLLLQIRWATEYQC